MKFVLLIGGKKQHGKDSHANEIKDYIESSTGISCARYSYASKMKEILIDLGIITQKQAYDSDKTDKTMIRRIDLRQDLQYKVKDEYLDVREILQLFGNDIMKKHLGEDVWVRAMAKQIVDNKRDMVYIISDYRFHGLESDQLLNILQAIDKGIKLKTLYIIREGAPVNKDDHESENSLRASQCNEVYRSYNLEDIRENAILIGEEIMDILSRMQ